MTGRILEVVGARGFEPPTPWSRTRCATRLRYAPSGMRSGFRRFRVERYPYPPYHATQFFRRAGAETLRLPLIAPNGIELYRLRNDIVTVVRWISGRPVLNDFVAKLLAAMTDSSNRSAR